MALLRLRQLASLVQPAVGQLLPLELAVPLQKPCRRPPQARI